MDNSNIDNSEAVIQNSMLMMQTEKSQTCKEKKIGAIYYKRISHTYVFYSDGGCMADRLWS